MGLNLKMVQNVQLYTPKIEIAEIDSMFAVQLCDRFDEVRERCRAASNDEHKRGSKAISEKQDSNGCIRYYLKTLVYFRPFL